MQHTKPDGISIQQHSETDLLTGRVSLTHDLQHGVLIVAAWTSCCCLTYQILMLYTCKACKACSCPCLNLIACGSRHLAASFRNHAKSPFATPIAPQLHVQGACQGSC